MACRLRCACAASLCRRPRWGEGKVAKCALQIVTPVPLAVAVTSLLGAANAGGGNNPAGSFLMFYGVLPTINGRPPVLPKVLELKVGCLYILWPIFSMLSLRAQASCLAYCLPLAVAATFQLQQLTHCRQLLFVHRSGSAAIPISKS